MFYWVITLAVAFGLGIFSVERLARHSLSEKILRPFSPDIRIQIYCTMKALVGMLLATPGFGTFLEFIPWIHAPESFLWSLWSVGAVMVVADTISPFYSKPQKPVGTSLGALSILSPVAALAGLFFFFVYYGSSRRAVEGVLLGLLVSMMVHLAWYTPTAHLWFGALIVFVILVRYEPEMDVILKERRSSS